ncbi:hypothetical protein C8J30_11291, partial [Rhodobacter viridis]
MSWMQRGKRLERQTIMLAAGMPEGEPEGDAVARISGWDIDQAIVALARAVFAEGGRLVAESDTPLTLLLAMIAAEYQTQRFAEGSGHADADLTPSVRVHRTRTRSDREDEDEALLERYSLVDFVDGADDDPFAENEISTPSPRDAPIALVCIGGGADVIEQAHWFASKESYRPIFVLETTGGAAARLAVVACCRFRGHEDKIVTKETEIGHGETEVHEGVQ